MSDDLDDDRLDVQAAAAHLRKPPPPAPALQSPDRSAYELEARRHLVAAEWRQRIPAKLLDAHLDDLEGLTGGGDIGTWAAGQWLDGVNLVLLGATGVGKSHAAVAACRPVIEQGHSCLYWPVPDLMAALDWNDPDHRATMRAAQGCDVLVLDDLGAEDPNEWTRRKLYELIAHRWNDNLATIGTTNLEPTDLEEAVGPRTYSRLAGGAIAVRLVGPDRRRTP